ncbi:MAG: hypothetical protein AAFU70_13670, partial [Planctomycetota bacterium]
MDHHRARQDFPFDLLTILGLAREAVGALAVDPSSLRTEKSFVIHEASGRRIAYGDLAADASELPLP